MELQILQQIIARVLHVDAKEVTPGTTFVKDLGADSLDMFQIATLTEDKFDIRITDREIRNIIEVQDLIRLIRNKRS